MAKRLPLGRRFFLVSSTRNSCLDVHHGLFTLGAGRSIAITQIITMPKGNMVHNS
jgi:hypothetical protein